MAGLSVLWRVESIANSYETLFHWNKKKSRNDKHTFAAVYQKARPSAPILPLPVTLKVRSTSHLICLFEKCTISTSVRVTLLPVKVCCFFTPNHSLLTSKTWSNSDAFFRSDSIPWNTNISQLDKKTKQIWGGKALILRGQIHISHQNIRRMALIHLSEQGMAAWMNICTQTWSKEVKKNFWAAIQAYLLCTPWPVTKTRRAVMRRPPRHLWAGGSITSLQMTWTLWNIPSK